MDFSKYFFVKTWRKQPSFAENLGVIEAANELDRERNTVCVIRPTDESSSVNQTYI